MTAVHAHRMRLAAGTIYYRAFGAGPPLVLLHGLSGSGRWWRRNVAALAQHYRVYLVDLIGFGRSRGQSFVLSLAGRGLGEWLDRMRLEHVSVIGHSMGGYIAIDLAANYAERIQRLVLVDALALPMDRSVLRSALGLAHALRYMPFNFLPVLIGDAFKAGPKTLWSAGREVLAADISDDLSRIRAPALIVWGENDKLLPVQLGRLLHKRLPGARFELIRRAGHNPMWDRPQQFNHIVLEFLQARTHRQEVELAKTTASGSTYAGPEPTKSVERGSPNQTCA